MKLTNVCPIWPRVNTDCLAWSKPEIESVRSEPPLSANQVLLDNTCLGSRTSSRLRLRSSTQNGHGPDGHRSQTWDFRQNSPKFNYEQHRTDAGHLGPDQTDPRTGTERTEPRPTLGHNEQTQDLDQIEQNQG